MHFWPDICEDNGWTTTEQTGKEARKSFITTFSSRRCFREKGAVAALSKWNSTQKALKLASPDLTTKLCCLSVLLLKTKVISHIDELYKMFSKSPLILKGNLQEYVQSTRLHIR